MRYTAQFLSPDRNSGVSLSRRVLKGLASRGSLVLEIVRLLTSEPMDRELQRAGRGTKHYYSQEATGRLATIWKAGVQNQLTKNREMKMRTRRIKMGVCAWDTFA